MKETTNNTYTPPNADADMRFDGELECLEAHASAMLDIDEEISLEMAVAHEVYLDDIEAEVTDFLNELDAFMNAEGMDDVVRADTVANANIGGLEDSECYYEGCKCSRNHA
jgi:hypothetical protein